MNQIKSLSSVNVKRLAFLGVGLIGLGGSVSSMAGYQVHSPGPLLTLGKTTHPSTTLSFTSNPAGGELLLGKDESLRMGYFSSLGIDIETGDVDNFIDDVDDFAEISNEVPALIDSSLAADYAGFTVSVDVACDDSIGVNTDGAKLVTVTITDPIGNDSVFSVYKGNY